MRLGLGVGCGILDFSLNRKGRHIENTKLTQLSQAQINESLVSRLLVYTS